MRNWRKWEAGAARRSERARHAANARWETYHDAMPRRETRVVEITVRDSHRPLTRIRAEQFEDGDGRWSRWHVVGHAGRPRGKHGLGQLLAGVFA